MRSEGDCRDGRGDERGVEGMTNAERCYECTGYGDDWYTDPETGEQVMACQDCPYNGEDEDE